MLKPLPITVVPADQALASIAGRLRAVTAEAVPNLGDRFWLALAQRDGLPAWASDQAWKVVAKETGVDVVVIRRANGDGTLRQRVTWYPNLFGRFCDKAPISWKSLSDQGIATMRSGRDSQNGWFRESR